MDWGAYVSTVDADGPAGQGGIQSGDIITRIGEGQIDEKLSFVNALFDHQPGEDVKIGLLRNNRPLEVVIRLGESVPNR